MKIFSKDYRDYKRKIKEEAKNNDLKGIDNILANFNSVMIAHRDDDGATFQYQTICYIYNKDGVNYAIDIKDMEKYYVSEAVDTFCLSDKDKQYIELSENYAYKREKINFDYYLNIKNYDNDGKTGLRYNSNELDKIIKDIKCFIVATNGLNVNSIESIINNSIDDIVTSTEVYDNVKLAKVVSVQYIEYVSEKNQGRKRKTRFALQYNNLPVIIESIDGIEYGVSLDDPSTKYEILKFENIDLDNEQYTRLGNRPQDLYIYDIESINHLSREKIDEITTKYFEIKTDNKKMIRKKKNL